MSAGAKAVQRAERWGSPKAVQSVDETADRSVEMLVVETAAMLDTQSAVTKAVTTVGL
jgi:hypothetical protein